MNTAFLNVPDFIKIGLMAFLFITLLSLFNRKAPADNAATA